MSEKPKPVTPAEAKAVWESMPEPSSRKVAARFTQAGRKVSFKTISTWKRQNWGLTPEAVAAKAEKAIAKGKEAADTAAAVITGDPTAKAEDVAEGDDDGLENATGAQVGDETIRNVLRLVNSVGKLLKDAGKANPERVIAAPHIIAQTVKDLAIGTAGLVETLIRMPIAREAGLKTVTGTVIEHTIPLENDPSRASFEAIEQEIKRIENDTDKPAAAA